MKSGRPSRALLIVAVLTAGLTWPLAFVLWRTGEQGFAASLFLLGASLGPCLAAYALVPTRRKQAARHVVLVTGGLCIMAFAVLGAVNLDLEGFFMLLMKASMGAAVGHTMVTLVLGPLLCGRFLCGWGCWRSMILELLPVGRGKGRRVGVWKLLPYVGLALSFGGAAASLLVFGHHPGGTPAAMHAASVRAILAGFAIYYAASIGLALALQDQRAFCKYLCPSAVILGLTSRLSLFKMTPDSQLCNACGACSRVCPMDVDVARFAAAGLRVQSGQCIICQRCAHACPTGALRFAARPVR